MPYQQLALLYAELQRRFVEQHAATERKCHDIYEASLRQRELADRRTREVTDTLLKKTAIMQRQVEWVYNS